MADGGNQQEFPTILGPDANFKGELSFEKGLRLMGKFEGRITSGGRLHIAKEARMQADVEIVDSGEEVAGHEQGRYRERARRQLSLDLRGRAQLWRVGTAV